MEVKKQRIIIEGNRIEITGTSEGDFSTAMALHEATVTMIKALAAQAEVPVAVVIGGLLTDLYDDHD